MLNNPCSILQYLEIVAPILPAPIYWLDRNGAVLGANEAALKSIGCKSITEILGKTSHDFHPPEIARRIVQHDQQVMQTGQTLEQEEPIIDLSTGRTRYYKAVKMPLRDEQGNIIGLVGTSIEITAEKENERLKLEEAKKINIMKHLEIIADSFPTPVYWNSLNSTVWGVNEQVIKAAGAKSREEFVGKTVYELYSKEIAEKIVKHNKIVVETGKMLSQEEKIQDISTGQIKYFNAFKAPLRDEDGKIIGTLGTSIEITKEKEAVALKIAAEKEAALLRLENERQKAIAQEQEKFRKIAGQVSHDIRSPLACLSMIVQACQDIPERERVALRSAATKINDIANNMLNLYAKKETQPTQNSETEKREAILLSPFILQILTDKKYQYKDLSVTFDHAFTQPGNFCWINIELTTFERMLSNIINNAVDAFDQRAGQITVHLDADDQQVRLVVEDNGKGMRPELVQKIMGQLAVTEGKKDGHGIGLTQVRETLQNNEGQLAIESEVGLGTKMILTFPRVPSQNWVAETMPLKEDDIVIILDDDSSIHLAWDTRFDQILAEYPDLTIKHFEIGQDTLNFINALPPEKKQKVFLLTDYELLKQKINGVDVVNQSAIKRSILVTSHYANKSVRNSAIQAGTQILPKQLAHDINISITAVAEVA